MAAMMSLWRRAGEEGRSEGGSHVNLGHTLMGKLSQWITPSVRSIDMPGITTYDLPNKGQPFKRLCLI